MRLFPMKPQSKTFEPGGNWVVWVSIGWTILLAAALCVALCLADIPHLSIWR